MKKVIFIPTTDKHRARRTHLGTMRKPRILRKGARYHVIARANRQEMIFAPLQEKELFINIIKRAKQKYTFRVENFCIMNNHYHLMMYPEGDENLSRIMQWIMSVFAMAYNRRHHLSGHVWGERFFSRIMADLRDYLRTVEYIDVNPVMALLVINKRDWAFGGLAYRRQGRKSILSPLPPGITLLLSSHEMLRLE